MYKVIVKHTDGTETTILAETKGMASFAVASVVAMLRAAGVEPDPVDVDRLHEDETNLTLHMMKNDNLVATITAAPVAPMSLH